MTNLPPPMSPPVSYAYPQQRPTNAWAIVSLVCGVIGCLVVTPFVAVVTGLVGLGKSRLQGGRGMAVTGLVLGILWLVGGTVAGVGGYFLYKNAATIVATAAKPQTIVLLNRLGSGNTTRDATTAGLTDADLQSAAAVAASLGRCNDINISRTQINNNGGQVTVEFAGTAVFDKGTAPIDARMRFSRTGVGPAVMEYEHLDLK